MALFGSLTKLFSFLVRYTRHIRNAHLLGAGIIAAAVASGVANTLLVALVNQVINAEGEGRMRLLPVFLAICVLFPVMRYVGDWLLIYLTEKATLHLRLTLCRQMLAVPLRKLEELGAGRMNATLLNDLPAVIGAMTLIPLLTLNLTIVTGSLVYMGVLSWRMLLGVLVFLVLGVVAYQLPLVRGHAHIKALREKGDDLFRHFRSLTDGIKELKLHHERRRAFLEQELQGTAVQVQNHSVAAQRAFSSAVSWGQVLIFVLIACVAFVLPALAPVDKPVLTGFTFAILYMVGPVQIILNSMAQLSRATVAMDRVEAIGVQLAENARPEAALPARTDGPAWTSLQLDGVTHTYRSERDGSAFTLGPVDLTFHPGEIVFITGGNGSGKTSLAKLLTGLYQPESGTVRLDGRPVDEAGQERFYALFSAVFSDFFLFDSLLGLGRDSLDDDAAHYLRELQLDHKVKVVDGTLSTTELSQGQRKRLALLTAYLEDRPVYLFDEWAADQDPTFKDVFYHELLPALRARGKTVFAISHDDRYYDVADRVIKLDYGQVVHDSARDGAIQLAADVRLVSA
ncbi:cyclic peptide export ABC transporter [Longimicrobium sp.]|uniref:cyclic peptide export ABC transporter n=1 Tax=Longimicrobium sp. TaxID=2029185 RepID=UPI002E31327E|nr:cyclic peptide export ABC transporter [Longimicrobium sp.]HEX6040885.1 cyclic peptide export ABC transporter [Longimicrobium sp.]